jgi:hypothetical protein
MLDNCCIHNGDGRLNLCIAHGRDSDHMTPKPPMLNQIEDCIGDAKHRIRTIPATTLRLQLFNSAALSCGQRT